MDKSVKNSIAFVIYNEDRTKILLVKRPPDDENLPNVWGLPAGSLHDNETFENAVLRSSQEKLGVHVKIVKLINEGETQRNFHVLHMKEFEVQITEGVPKVPQVISNVTQYTEYRWGVADDLHEAAEKGSLCSKLYLESLK